MLTGSYNFFNYLTIVLMVSVLDEEGVLSIFSLIAFTH